MSLELNLYPIIIYCILSICNNYYSCNQKCFPDCIYAVFKHVLSLTLLNMLKHHLHKIIQRHSSSTELSSSTYKHESVLIASHLSSLKLEYGQKFSNKQLCRSQLGNSLLSKLFTPPSPQTF